MAASALASEANRPTRALRGTPDELREHALPLVWILGRQQWPAEVLGRGKVGLVHLQPLCQMEPQQIPIARLCDFATHFLHFYDASTQPQFRSAVELATRKHAAGLSGTPMRGIAASTLLGLVPPGAPADVVVPKALALLDDGALPPCDEHALVRVRPVGGEAATGAPHESVAWVDVGERTGAPASSTLLVPRGWLRELRTAAEEAAHLARGAFVTVLALDARGVVTDIAAAASTPAAPAEQSPWLDGMASVDEPAGPSGPSTWYCVHVLETGRSLWCARAALGRALPGGYVHCDEGGATPAALCWRGEGEAGVSSASSAATSTWRSPEPEIALPEAKRRRGRPRLKPRAEDAPTKPSKGGARGPGRPPGRKNSTASGPTSSSTTVPTRSAAPPPLDVRWVRVADGAPRPAGALIAEISEIAISTCAWTEVHQFLECARTTDLDAFNVDYVIRQVIPMRGGPKAGEAHVLLRLTSGADAGPSPSLASVRGVLAATVKESRRAPFVEFRAVYVDRAMRGKSLARALVHAALKLAHEVATGGLGYAGAPLAGPRSQARELGARVVLPHCMQTSAAFWKRMGFHLGDEVDRAPRMAVLRSVSDLSGDLSEWSRREPVPAPPLAPPAVCTV